VGAENTEGETKTAGSGFRADAAGSAETLVPVYNNRRLHIPQLKLNINANLTDPHL
jgi:hypothetical protein